ncbi:hypothetical protein BDZ89DRAFT_1043960 [Hymenopellis radicata]|nr:hypothetical protein BDZ89DRAFT_1043960 [Hymenopellis radicata]
MTFPSCTALWNIDRTIERLSGAKKCAQSNSAIDYSWTQVEERRLSSEGPRFETEDDLSRLFCLGTCLGRPKEASLRSYFVLNASEQFVGTLRGSPPRRNETQNHLEKVRVLVLFLAPLLINRHSRTNHSTNLSRLLLPQACPQHALIHLPIDDTKPSRRVKPSTFISTPAAEMGISEVLAALPNP